MLFFVDKSLWMSYLVDVKIHILFKTTTLFLKKNLISISFLIN